MVHDCGHEEIETAAPVVPGIYFKLVMKWVSRCIACYKNLPHVAFASQGYDII